MREGDVIESDEEGPLQSAEATESATMARLFERPPQSVNHWEFDSIDRKKGKQENRLKILNRIESLIHDAFIILTLQSSDKQV